MPPQVDADAKKTKKPRVKKPKPQHDFKIIKATPEAPIVVSFK